MFLTNFQTLVFCFLFSPEFELVHVFVSYKLFLIKHTACTKTNILGFSIETNESIETDVKINF